MHAPSSNTETIISIYTSMLRTSHCGTNIEYDEKYLCKQFSHYWKYGQFQYDSQHREAGTTTNNTLVPLMERNGTHLTV